MTDHDLLFYVQRLTRPYREPVVQRHTYHVPGMGVHEIACVSHTDHDGLLKQLRDAVYSGIGHHGASTAGAARLPFDAGALAMYEQIEKRIGEMYVAQTAKPVPLELERTLHEWYLSFTDAVKKGRFTDDDHEAARRRVRLWVEQIEGLFNPPKRLELTVERTEVGDGWTSEVSPTGGMRVREFHVTRTVRIPAPCPECENRYAEDEDTGDQKFAMILEYWELGPETFGNLRATCRACRHEWHGQDAARDLMVQIDETDRTLQEVEKARKKLTDAA